MTTRPAFASWRTPAMFIAAGTVAILLIPLVAMRFTSDVEWSATDFATAAVVLVGGGALFSIAMRTFGRYRVVACAVVAAALLYVWAELAVGIFTNWGR